MGGWCVSCLRPNATTIGAASLDPTGEITVKKRKNDPNSTALVIKSNMSTGMGQCDKRMTPGALQPSPTCAVVMRS